MNTAEDTKSMVGSEGIMVHLEYLRRDIKTLTENQKNTDLETKAILKEIRDGSPSRGEFIDLQREVATKADDLQFKDVKNMVENKLVTKDDFAPIKKFVYATITLVVVTVFVAILGNVINSNPKSTVNYTSQKHINKT